jgi:peroxiredoxin 2/4
MAVLVGKKAPSFSAKAVLNGDQIVDEFSLDQYLGKKYVLFYFYPADFTFVCPTEIIAFQNKIEEFEKRNVAVVGCSVDSEFTLEMAANGKERWWHQGCKISPGC